MNNFKNIFLLLVIICLMVYSYILSKTNEELEKNHDDILKMNEELLKMNEELISDKENLMRLVKDLEKIS